MAGLLVFYISPTGIMPFEQGIISRKRAFPIARGEILWYAVFVKQRFISDGGICYGRLL